MSRAKTSPFVSQTVDLFESDTEPSTVPISSEKVDSILSRPTPSSNASQIRLHRLAMVRNEQGVSLTRIARRLGVEIAEARRQEQPATDLLLSQLYRWREILEVPVGELILEPDEIPGNPIKNRGQLIKIMKTARTIIESARDEGTAILGRMLFDQLVELMPELQTIAAWPSIGQAREQRDLGQAAYRRFDSNVSRFLDNQ